VGVIYTPTFLDKIQIEKVNHTRVVVKFQFKTWTRNSAVKHSWTGTNQFVMAHPGLLPKGPLYRKLNNDFIVGAGAGAAECMLYARNEVQSALAA
jgi:hypothetical protein